MSNASHVLTLSQIHSLGTRQLALTTPPTKASLEQLRQGDGEAFEQLVERTRHTLWRVARGVSHGDAQAHDLLQECYTIAYTSLLKGTWDGRQERAWLRTVLVRLELRRMRRQRSWRRILRILQKEGAHVERTADQVLPMYLRKALEQLPIKQRIALVLKVLEDAPQRDIADALECSEGAVEQLLVRARRTLKTALEDFKREDQ